MDPTKPIEGRTKPETVAVYVRRFIALTILLLSVVGIWQWRVLEVIPRGHDATYHLQVTMRHAQILVEDPILLGKVLVYQPAHYQPLVYLVATSFLLLSDFSPLSFHLTTLIFWCLALAGLYWLGVYQQPRKTISLLPLFVFLSVPAAWLIGTAYNLESSVVAGSLIILLLLFKADRLDTRLRLAGAVIIVIVCSLTKPVMLLGTVPAGLILVLPLTTVLRRRQAILLGAVLLSAFSWLGYHSRTLINEFYFDYTNPVGELGTLYYFKLLLIEYHGIPLLIALGLVLIQRFRQRQISRIDGAFAAFFLVPLIFFLNMSTKWAWYPLAAYCGLPIWYLYSLKQIDISRSIKLINAGLMVFYFTIAASNLGAVLAKVNPDHPKHNPEPPSAVEKAIAREITQNLEMDPKATFALKTKPGPASTNNISMLILFQNPYLVNNLMFVTAEWTDVELIDLIRSLSQMKYFYAISEGWPTLDQSHYDMDNSNISFSALADKLAQDRQLFRLQRIVDLPDGRKLSVFANKRPETTRRSQNILKLYQQQIGRKKILPPSGKIARRDLSREDWLNRIQSRLPRRLENDVDQPFVSTTPGTKSARKSGLEAMRQGQYQTAVDLLRQVVAASPGDQEARFKLAHSLANFGKSAEALFHWQVFFRISDSFGQQIDALRNIAESEAAQKTPAGSFLRFYQPIRQANLHLPDREYTLLSTKLYAEQLARDWPAAHATLKQLRRVLTPPQTPGVDLHEAKILIEMKQFKKAETILKKLLSEITPEHPVYVGAALTSCRLLTMQKRFDAAANMLANAASANVVPQSLAIEVAHLAGALSDDQQTDKARQLLLLYRGQLSDDAAGFLDVEIGKWYLARKQKEEARQAFQRALESVTDQQLRQWIEQTLADL